MVFLRWLIGGLIGGAIGGAVWVAIGYNMQAEVGIIAWAIGFLCGLGVQIVGGAEDGFVPGFVAVGCAAVTILMSKYLVISMLFGTAVAGVNSMEVTNTDMIASYAEEIIEKQREAGKKVKLPPSYDDPDARVETQYPRKVWGAAIKRWNKHSAAEKEELKQERTEMFNELMQNMQGSLTESVFMSSFNPMDLLWFGLAAFTAFKVGSGMVTDDD